jgi:hypothetical protein
MGQGRGACQHWRLDCGRHPTPAGGASRRPTLAKTNKASPASMPARARQAGRRGRAHAATSSTRQQGQEGQARRTSPHPINTKQCSRGGRAWRWPDFAAAASPDANAARMGEGAGRCGRGAQGAEQAKGPAIAMPFPPRRVKEHLHACYSHLTGIAPCLLSHSFACRK